MSYIVNEQWLKNRLEEQSNETIVIDVRFQLDKPNKGREDYLQSHIPSAVYMDLDKDLSGEAQKHGGNHPLPDTKVFAEKLGSIGVNHDKVVVIYDQGNSMVASRAWWLLHYMGHEKVYVLDGGFKAWNEAGNKVTSEIIKSEQTTFDPRIVQNMTVNIEQVKEIGKASSTTLIDSRAKNRYLGIEEKMYAKAGHIPGAKNYFWEDVLTKEDTWKKSEELSENFSSLEKDDEIIVSCGSGVSACPNIIALKMAGYTNVKLYPGSFSDWISYEENELETVEE